MNWLHIPYHLRINDDSIGFTTTDCYNLLSFACESICLTQSLPRISGSLSLSGNQYLLIEWNILLKLSLFPFTHRLTNKQDQNVP